MNSKTAISTRILFCFAAILTVCFYLTTSFDHLLSSNEIIKSIIIGTLIALTAFSIEFFLKRCTPKLYLIVGLGLFVGYLAAVSLLVVLNAMYVEQVKLPTEFLIPAKVALYLISGYLGIAIVAKIADEIHIRIPSIQRSFPADVKKTSLLIDPYLLEDLRLVELASSGLLNQTLLIPKALLEQWQNSIDENLKTKYVKSLEIIRKLENSPFITLKLINDNPKDVKEWNDKLLSISKHYQAHLLSSNLKPQFIESTELKIVNINVLAHTLKPVVTISETFNIKIQRYGKEPKQGVGYLEDGTMVVVNGGADFLGEIIRAHVVSNKNTASGRIIFCNAIGDLDESLALEEEAFASV